MTRTWKVCVRKTTMHFAAGTDYCQCVCVGGGTGDTTRKNITLSTRATTKVQAIHSHINQPLFDRGIC